MKSYLVELRGHEHRPGVSAVEAAFELATAGAAIRAAEQVWTRSPRTLRSVVVRDPDYHVIWGRNARRSR